MAYVAVDLDETEWVFRSKPKRTDGVIWGIKNYKDYGIELPRGSIAKLIGRELTWSDEPVELVETKGEE